MTTQRADIGWCILEILGHRKLGGYLSEATLAGAGFLRIQVPQVGAEKGWSAEQLYAPSAVYAITPTTEAIARGVATRCQPEPVTRWELPAPADERPRRYAEPEEVCVDCGAVNCVCPEEEEEERIEVVDEGADCPRCGNPVCCCPPSVEQMEAALVAAGKDETFSDSLGGTIRRCRTCRIAVFGGPTRCETCAAAVPPESELAAALRPPIPEQPDLYESASSPISLEDAERLRSGLPLRPAVEDSERPLLETIQTASSVRPTAEQMESALSLAAGSGESIAFLEGGWLVIRCSGCNVPVCYAHDEPLESSLCPGCAATPPPTAPTPEALPGSSDDDVPF